MPAGNDSAPSQAGIGWDEASGEGLVRYGGQMRAMRANWSAFLWSRANDRCQYPVHYSCEEPEAHRWAPGCHVVDTKA